jgi:hypothetical protein
MRGIAARPRLAETAAVRVPRLVRAETGAAAHARVSAAIAAVAAAGIVSAGCGSATAGSGAAGQRPASLPLSTSVAVDRAAWAVVPMGGTGENLFWQLFVLPSGGARWTLATPPGVATNGAIALGAATGRSLTAAIHPSLLLRFSPVISTANGGKTWTPGRPGPSLGAVPDALAGAPSGGQLIAIDRRGRALLSRPGGTRWSTLTSASALARGQAGGAGGAARACRPVALTAAAFSPSGDAVLGSDCARPGVAGIFAERGGQWHAAGPVMPASLSSRPVRVLRLVRTGDRLTALLQAGAGRTARLLVAWQASGRWTLSAALPLSAAGVTSSSFGRDGGVAVELGGRRAEYLAGPGSSWRALPALPPGHAVTLALPSGGGAVDALAASRSVLTVWRLHAGMAGGAGSWVKAQTTKVPIQYGSSG